MKVFGDEIFTGNGTGYNMHPHHNFIIMAFVLRGELTHINTIGKIDVLKADDFYVFSAGSGGKHTELNIERDDANIIYVWALPGRLLAPPSYFGSRFDRVEHRNTLVELVGQGGVLPIDQDLRISRLVSDAGKTYAYTPAAASHGTYAFVVEGVVQLANEGLQKRDSVGLWGVQTIDLETRAEGTDLLIVETAP